MLIIHKPKRQHYEINGILKRKKECTASLKYSVFIFVGINMQNATSGG
jgi:hypothetical protein